MVPPQTESLAKVKKSHRDLANELPAGEEVGDDQSAVLQRFELSDPAAFDGGMQSSSTPMDKKRELV